MKLPRVVLITLSMILAGPATAAQHCSCTGGYVTSHGAVCTAYDCEELPMFAPSPTLTLVRSAKSCPRSRALFCDYGSCKLVCDTSKK